MSKIKRLIVDFSSLCWTTLLAGTDDEHFQEVEHNGKIVKVNGWQHGYENAINSLLSAWAKNSIQPINTILVEESGNSKGLRKRWLPTYKDDRDSGRPKEAYTQFNILKEKLIEAVRSIGGSVVTRPNIEGDDVVAYLCHTLDGIKVVMTGDRDLAVLLNDEVSLWRANELITENPYGPWPHQWIPVHKALVGDSSDKIPGAKGFGPKAWLDLICIFGPDGVEMMEDIIKDKKIKTLVEDVDDLKALEKVIENEDKVYASYTAGLLYPQMCENMRVPLQWQPGYVKPRAQIEDERLRKYGGAVRLVHANNYDEAVKWALPHLKASASVALDIETSVPQEAIEWLQTVKNTDKEDKLGVDVLGSELNGLSLTFGLNNQFTLYFTCGHLHDDETPNLTSEQIRQVVAQIPAGIPTVIQNVSFELPILYMEWGQDQVDNGWHGFLPNCHDTKILASYVNENISSGLKQSSKHYFDYDQVSYQEVTQGRKMNEMTATEVLDYGADDTIMTAALYQHFKVICEIEDTWDAYIKVEVKPAYLTALAFVQGTKISLSRMLELEAEDKVEAEIHQKIIDAFLVKAGWEGTVCPKYTAEDLNTAASIKDIYLRIIGEPLVTKVRTPDKLFKLIGAEPDTDHKLLAKYMAEGDLAQINDWVSSKFSGSPELNLGSPKQMQDLLYRVLGLEVKIINALTDNERENKRDLASACYRFNKITRGSQSEEPLTDEEKVLIIQKASTDDTAMQFALLDELEPEVRTFLQALMALKTLNTRFTLFYNKYRHIRHWKTEKVHASINQCATVTRRYSASGPNLQQLPKKGEGVKFRKIFVPHKLRAVICSVDFSGQELRLGADQSKDPAMLACFIGDHKQDMHSLTAAGAMTFKWGVEKVNELAEEYGVDISDDEGLYKLFIKVRAQPEGHPHHKLADDLRKTGKNVNFGAQYDSQAPTLAKTIIIPLADAQAFLDAKYARFARFEVWKDEVKEDLHSKGYVTTLLGARRHLTEQIQADNKWEVAKAERQGPNMKIQGSAAEQTKLCMAALWDSGAMFKFDVQFIAPVHDELVTSVAVEDALEFIKIKHECMTIKYMDEVPEVGSISVGPDFGEQYECGEEYDAEKISAAIERCQEAVYI